MEELNSESYCKKQLTYDSVRLYLCYGWIKRHGNIRIVYAKQGKDNTFFRIILISFRQKKKKSKFRNNSIEKHFKQFYLKASCFICFICFIANRLYLYFDRTDCLDTFNSFQRADEFWHIYRNRSLKTMYMQPKKNAIWYIATMYKVLNYIFLYGQNVPRYSATDCRLEWMKLKNKWKQRIQTPQICPV